jgi:WXG100 family type VII secretion target
MPDINLDYDGVIQAANQLRTARGQLDQKLQRLKAMIDNLISSQFKTTAASGKLGEAYTKFTNAVTKANESLDGMARYLDSVKQQHEELDQQLAGGFGGLGGFGG